MSGSAPLRLAVVILNYRTPRLVLDCLRSLAAQPLLAQERVVVVDNGSGDDSVRTIREALTHHGWTEWAQLIEADGNRGFSAGNNLGIRALDAEAHLLLNSDTYLRPGALAELRAALAENPEVDLIAPRLEWPDATPQRSAFRFPSAWSELERSAGTGPVSHLLRHWVVAPSVSDQEKPFEWASFAAILIRRRAFERTGLLDEGYFLYFEDVDFCRRAASAGCRALYWPRARVVHLRGGSGPVKQRQSRQERLPRYFWASRSRYFGKFHGRSGLWAANLMWLFGRAISWPRELFRNKQPHLCSGEARDIWHGARRPVATLESWPSEQERRA